MDNLVEKLNDFSALIIRDANEKKEEKLKELETEYKKIMELRENEYLKGVYREIQDCVGHSRKDANERLLKVEMDSKRELLLKREDIIESVAAEVKVRLEKFKTTPEYAEWLKNKTEAAFFELGDGRKEIVIAADDLRHKEMLEQISNKCETVVEAAKDGDFLGGVKVINTDSKISADYSFKDMLEAEKKLFLQTSGLAIS